MGNAEYMGALSCNSFPIMICYFSDLEKDLYSRSISGVTLRQRATADFLNWLTRRGVMAEQTSPSADLGTRSNLPALTMMTGDKEATACITFDGKEVCGPTCVLPSGGLTCVFDGAAWVCA